jgi:hypothetical protein
MRDLEFVVGKDYRVETAWFVYSALCLDKRSDDELIFVNLNDDDCDTVTIKLREVISANLI